MKSVLWIFIVTIICLCLVLAFCVSAFAWGSDPDISVLSTHPALARQSLDILFNDLSNYDKSKKSFMNAFKLIKLTYLDRLLQGSVDADSKMKKYDLFQDHFYNPYTKSNFTILKTDPFLASLTYVFANAESNTRLYLSEAKYLWKSGKYSEAVYNLGLGIHYCEDACVPHHASDALSAIYESKTKHSAFESFTDKRISRYYINSLGGKTSSPIYQNGFSQKYFADFLRDYTNRYAFLANASYHNDFKAKDQSTWDKVARYNTKNTQEKLAIILYRFIWEVIGTNKHTSSNTALSFRVKTRSGSLKNTYGTSNHVYAGAELKDGRLQEWRLDKTGYNDFNKGDNDRYNVILKGANASDIRKVWLRKQRGAGQRQDDWWPVEVQVNDNIDNKVLNKTFTVNKWINGNFGFSYDLETGEILRLN